MIGTWVRSSHITFDWFRKWRNTHYTLSDGSLIYILVMYEYLRDDSWEFPLAVSRMDAWFVSTIHHLKLYWSGIIVLIIRSMGSSSMLVNCARNVSKPSSSEIIDEGMIGYLSRSVLKSDWFCNDVAFVWMICRVFHTTCPWANMKNKSNICIKLCLMFLIRN